MAIGDDYFGISDSIKATEPPPQFVDVHQDGMTWAVQGESYNDTTRIGDLDWNRIIAQFRGLFVNSGIDLSDLNASSNEILREAILRYVNFRVNATLTGIDVGSYNLQPKSEKGVALGYVGLDADSEILPINLPQATETDKGALVIADAADVLDGTDNTKALTIAKMLARTANTSRAGVAALATSAEVQNGTLTNKAVTPSGLNSRTATETRTGIVELATVAEAVAGIDTSRAVTASGLKAALDALIAAAPGTLDTLNELAAALGNDPNFATTMTTALGNRVRVDTAVQGLNATQQENARTNINARGNLKAIVRILSSVTYTKPADVKSLLIKGQGAGGGGAGGNTPASTPSAGGGGGAGAYGEIYIAAPLASYAVAIGAAGVGGPVATAGGTGGATTVGSVLNLNGGQGGQVMSATGDLIVAGGLGGTVVTGGDRSHEGAFGGAATRFASNSARIGGHGANSVFGMGGGPQGPSVNPASTANGIVGTGYGSGGGGGISSTTTQTIGGAGRPGYVEIWEFF